MIPALAVIFCLSILAAVALLLMRGGDSSGVRER